MRRRSGKAADVAALAAAARNARRGAYAPYSRYLVGAAVRTAEGALFTGANVENASYGLSMCAERVAIFKAAAAGYRQIPEVAVATGGTKPAPPCGACRQVMAEFGVEDVYLVPLRGAPRRRRFRDLLPEAFTAKNLR